MKVTQPRTTRDRRSLIRAGKRFLKCVDRVTPGIKDRLDRSFEQGKHMPVLQVNNLWQVVYPWK